MPTLFTTPFQQIRTRGRRRPRCHSLTSPLQAVPLRTTRLWRICRGATPWRLRAAGWQRRVKPWLFPLQRGRQLARRRLCHGPARRRQPLGCWCHTPPRPQGVLGRFTTTTWHGRCTVGREGDTNGAEPFSTALQKSRGMLHEGGNLMCFIRIHWVYFVKFGPFFGWFFLDRILRKGDVNTNSALY